MNKPRKIISVTLAIIMLLSMALTGWTGFAIFAVADDCILSDLWLDSGTLQVPNGITTTYALKEMLPKTAKADSNYGEINVPLEWTVPLCPALGGTVQCTGVPAGGGYSNPLNLSVTLNVTRQDKLKERFGSVVRKSVTYDAYTDLMANFNNQNNLTSGTNWSAGTITHNETYKKLNNYSSNYNKDSSLNYICDAMDRGVSLAKNPQPDDFNVWIDNATDSYGWVDGAMQFTVPESGTAVFTSSMWPAARGIAILCVYKNNSSTPLWGGAWYSDSYFEGDDEVSDALEIPLGNVVQGDTFTFVTYWMMTPGWHSLGFQNPSITIYNEEIKPIIFGDANDDGVIDAKDLLAIKMHLASIESLSHYGKIAADIDKNGSINNNDIVALKMHLASITEIVQ